MSALSNNQIPYKLYCVKGKEGYNRWLSFFLPGAGSSSLIRLTTSRLLCFCIEDVARGESEQLFTQWDQGTTGNNKD
jgi:hypothetical protein